MDFNQLPRFKKHQFEIVSLISEWAAAYEVNPAAIERQIPIAHAWANSNPKRAPKKDPVRFLYNWMRLAKQHGNLIAERRKTVRQEEVQTEPMMTQEEMDEIKRRNWPQRPVAGSIDPRQAIETQEIK